MHYNRAHATQSQWTIGPQCQEKATLVRTVPFDQSPSDLNNAYAGNELRQAIIVGHRALLVRGLGNLSAVQTVSILNELC